MKPNCNKVFTVAQEDHLVAYIIKIAKMFYGLSVKDFCRLAYDYAVSCLSANIPIVWEEEMSASEHQKIFCFESEY